MKEIHPKNLIPTLLEASEGFTKVWNDLIIDYGDDEIDWWTHINEYGGLYSVFNALAIYVAKIYKLSQFEELQRIFDLVEQWHREGGHYVKEATTVGFLEDLSNLNVVGNIDTSVFIKYMGPDTKHWWQEVKKFWETGKIIGVEEDT